MEKKIKHDFNIQVRLITVFINKIVSSSILPFMALYLSSIVGVTAAGIVLSFSVICSFVAGIVGGYITEVYTRKNILVISSTVRFAMVTQMTLALIKSNATLMIIAYILFNIFGSIGRPAMQAVVMDATTLKNRKKIYTLDYWYSNVAMAIGVFIGGFLYEDYRLILFVFLTLLSIISPIIYYIFLNDKLVVNRKKDQINFVLDVIEKYKIVLKDKKYIKVVIGSMFINFAELSLNSYIAVRLATTFSNATSNPLNLNGAEILSVLNLENVVIVVSLTFLISKIMRKYGEKQQLIIGLIIYGLGYSIMTYSTSIIVLALVMFVASVGELIYAPIKNTLQVNLIPEHKRGSYVAINSFSFIGGELIARLTLIFGAYISPIKMGILTFLLVLLGTYLLYKSFYK